MTSRTAEARLADRYTTSDLATVAPFVRGPLSVSSAMHSVLLAATPCVVMALYNTGLQANLGLLAGHRGSGWRANFIEAWGQPAPANLLDCVAVGALFFVPLLVVTWLSAGLCELGFARGRGRPANHVALPVIALLFTLSLPASLPLWQAAVGIAVGVVIGKEIFGGFGRNFLNPVVVGLAFLYFAYPGSLDAVAAFPPEASAAGGTVLAMAARSGMEGLGAAGFTWSSLAIGNVPGAMGETSALACLIGLAVLLYSRVASWRIIAGGSLGLLLGTWGLSSLPSPMAELPWHWHLVSGSFAFGLVYLATDPVTSAATNPGRWLYGALIGSFVAVVRIANPAHQDGVLLALLLGSVCAPLLDRASALVLARVHRATRVS